MARAAKGIKDSACQVEASIPHLFALGDAISVGDGMTIVAISRQGPWLAKTIKAVLAGKAVNSLAA
ncbi:MAG: hypothetical protein KBA31_14580 [Alphaproteobacteria bacterium]|nr:hypothetical protein [Alphaproteobacteria bacterium]